MTNSFINALTTNDALTANGAVTNSTTGSACLNLFSAIGAMRGKDVGPTFIKAFIENPELAVRTALWARDVRGGAGERSIFRDIGKFLLLDTTLDYEVKMKLLKTTVEVGRWDDVWAIAAGTPLEVKMISMIKTALETKDGLCAKWLPRKGTTAIKIRKGLGWSPKQYRKTIVELSNTVEQNMCAQDWTSIEFGKLPSVASARYQKAFTRHCGEAYSQYIEGLQKGTEKINASAVYPHDVIKSCFQGQPAVASAQWKALPNYMEGCEARRILPVVDTSYSMYTGINNKGFDSTRCLDVSIALGMYLSERNEGPFKDYFMTFSQTPVLQHLTGTLPQRLQQLATSSWGYNTNLVAVFTTLVNKSVAMRVPASEMPTDIVILSDMEFDRAVTSNHLSNFQAIDKMYESHGYKRPNLIFWNLNAREGNSPVKAHTAGTALISGFSPAIMKSVLRSETFNPEKIMLDTVMVERYNIFKEVA